MQTVQFFLFIFLGRPGYLGAVLLPAQCFPGLPYSILEALQRVPEEEVGHDSSNIPCVSYISHCASLNLHLHL